MATAEKNLFLPPPRQLTPQAGTFELGHGGIIHIGSDRPAELLFTAAQFKDRLAEVTRHEWHIRAGIETAAIALIIDPAVSGGPEAYTLKITPQAIQIRGAEAAGVFYGCQTLYQLLRQYGPQLPALQIEDSPDFPARGFMLDISRNCVPTMATLLALVDRLAEWKINQLQLYTEHTFAYADHETVWQHASPMTGEEIMALDAYCRDRFIDLVPNQASFAHMEHWLKHPDYKPLAESPDGWEINGQRVPYPFTLNPLHPGSLELVAGLYRDLLPHFSSRLFNINGDEPFDLGQGASRQAVEQRGKPDVYFEFINKLHQEVQAAGRLMLYWADFYWDYPESVALHPAGATALEWGYDAAHDFDGNTARLAAAGIPFYVCPGTSAWNSFLGRTDNAIANIANAAENGRKHGAIGLLNTNWGDNGDLAYLPVAYLGIAAGAAYAWNLKDAREMSLAEALSLHAFGDPTGETGRIVYDLGNVYKQTNLGVPNSVAPFWLLIKSTSTGWRPVDVKAGQLRQALEQMAAVQARWSQAQPSGPDAALVQDEFANNAAMWQHACRCGLALLEEQEGGQPDWPTLAGELQAIITEHHRLWLARCRPGGLAASAARLGSRLPHYLTRAGK